MVVASVVVALVIVALVVVAVAIDLIIIKLAASINYKLAVSHTAGRGKHLH